MYLIVKPGLNYFIFAVILIEAMWVCRMLIRIVAEVAEDLYDLHNLSFILSIGTVGDSLQLIELLDSEEQY